MFIDKFLTNDIKSTCCPFFRNGLITGYYHVLHHLCIRFKFYVDFGAVAEAGEVDNKMADKALRRLDVDNYGLDAFDRRYLQ